MTKTNDFKKAWFISCSIHKKENMLFFRKCWKCEIKKRVKTISEAKLLIPYKHLLTFLALLLLVSCTPTKTGRVTMIQGQRYRIEGVKRVFINNPDSTITINQLKTVKY